MSARREGASTNESIVTLGLAQPKKCFKPTLAYDNWTRMASQNQFAITTLYVVWTPGFFSPTLIPCPIVDNCSFFRFPWKDTVPMRPIVWGSPFPCQSTVAIGPEAFQNVWSKTFLYIVWLCFIGTSITKAATCLFLCFRPGLSFAPPQLTLGTFATQ